MQPAPVRVRTGSLTLGAVMLPPPELADIGLSTVPPVAGVAGGQFDRRLRPSSPPAQVASDPTRQTMKGNR
jgi:hypothetical protein